MNKKKKGRGGLRYKLTETLGDSLSAAYSRIFPEVVSQMIPATDRETSTSSEAGESLPDDGEVRRVLADFLRRLANDLADDVPDDLVADLASCERIIERRRSVDDSPKEDDSAGKGTAAPCKGKIVALGTMASREARQSEIASNRVFMSMRILDKPEPIKHIRPQP